MGNILTPGKWWKRAPKVVIGYPVGGSVTHPFHVSLMRLLTHELAKPERDRILGRITHTSGLYVGWNRQLLVEQFVKSGAPWLLQLDTDIEFPPTLLETLVQLAGEDRKVLAATVPLGAYASCAFRMKPDEVGVWRSLSYVPQEPIEVDGVATAVVLIHRDVFVKIAEQGGQTWFHHMYIPTAPESAPAAEQTYRFQGEDLAFSLRAKAAGFPLYAVHVPGLRHFKTQPLTHDVEVSTIEPAAAKVEG